MYKELPIDVIIPNPQNSNRISKMFSKKLRHNIQQIGLYETITVRPHPFEKNKFEILNGHARLEALQNIGINKVKCDIWDVNETKAHLFLAILNKLRGSDVPELRMNLLFDLLQEYPVEELVAHIPETSSYLKKLEQLPEEVEKKGEEEEELLDIVVITFYLPVEKHKVITDILNNIKEKYILADTSEALYKLALLFQQNYTK